MSIKVSSDNGVIKFEFENEAAPAALSQYDFVRHGASVFIYNKDQGKKLAACFNTFDNSFFVMDPDPKVYAMAELFGTKRFLVGDARKEKPENAIKFARDLSCPLVSSQEEKTVEGKTLEEVLKLYQAQKNKFYEIMVDLYQRCADFTPGKQQEYATGMADKFCRINLANHEPKDNVATDHIFLMDEKIQGKVLGVVSATIIVSPSGAIDVYFYDEIVDYFTKLNEDEDAKLKELHKKTPLSPEDQKAIADIVNPKRMEMLSMLFAAARTQIRATIKKSFPSVSDKQLNEAHGFIRAADGREKLYTTHLNCSAENTENYVIQSRGTSLKDALDNHVKDWAKEQLKQFAPVQSPAHVQSSLHSTTPKAAIAPAPVIDPNVQLVYTGPK